MLPTGFAVFGTIGGFLLEAAESMGLLSTVRYGYNQKTLESLSRDRRRQARESDTSEEKNYREDDLEKLDEVEKELRKKKREIQRLEKKKEKIYNAASEILKNELEQHYDEIERIYDDVLSSIESDERRQELKGEREQVMQEFIGDLMDIL